MAVNLAEQVWELGLALNRQRRAELLAEAGWSERSSRFHADLLDLMQGGDAYCSAAMTRLLVRSRKRDGE